MPNSNGGKRIKWNAGDGSSGEIVRDKIDPAQLASFNDEEELPVEIDTPQESAPVESVERPFSIEGEGETPTQHDTHLPNEGETSDVGTSSHSSSPSSPPPEVEPVGGPGEPPPLMDERGFDPVEPGDNHDVHRGAPTPGDRFDDSSEGGSPRGEGPGEPVQSTPPPGPASDPYDDKLGQAGENAPMQGNVPPSSQQPADTGSDTSGGDLGPKDGLDDKPGIDQKDGNKTGTEPKDGESGKKDSTESSSESGSSKGGNDRASGAEQGGQGGPAGNGYGALKNGRNGTSDPTANARRNLEHQNRSNGGERPRPSSGSSGGGNPLQNGLNNLKQRLNPFSRLKNGLSKPGLSKGENGSSGKTGGSGEGKSESLGSGVANIGKKVVSFIARHPYIAGIIIILIILLLLIIENSVIESGSNNSRMGTHCTYDLKGVVSTGSVKLDGIQVELINCDGKADNYEVLETIDFEKYVIGVALAEVSWSADNPEYFKSQIIAARGFALKRNSAMCPGSGPDTCFYGYNVNTQKIRLRACTNDQVYCDIDKPCYHVTRSGQPTIYGPEAEGMSGATVWKSQLSEETKAQILAAAEEVKGKVLVDSNGEVVYTNFVNTDQQEWHRMALEGKSAEEIMVEYYSGQGATGFNSANCTTLGNIDYGNYVLSSEGHEILHEPLDGFLEKNGTSLQEFADLISSNVRKNGYGTRAGVVAAAVTLIGELGNNYGVKIPYYWGGGHYDGVVLGPLGYWGSNQCHTYANNQSYDYCGFDCSGFVPWAIKNGGFDIGHMLAGNFQGLSGAQRVSLNSSSAVLQPGDLLESSGHIVLVIGVDEENKQYICAEASGNARGVLFTRRSFADSGYWGVQMDGYYETHVRSES